MKENKTPIAIVRKELKRLMKEWGMGPAAIIRILKGGGNSSKGSAYERETCKKLSLWWTHGERDDVFWRSSGSGARAKVRGRQGTATLGQHGDIAATDPIGKPLIDVFTIELKRGYTETSCQDPMDMQGNAKAQQWEGFIEQAMESAEMASSLSWMLVVRRNSRQALVWVPSLVMCHLRGVGSFSKGMPDFCVRMQIPSRLLNDGKISMYGMRLDTWLNNVTPDQVRAMVDKWGNIH